jgi:hypothetical protein
MTLFQSSIHIFAVTTLAVSLHTAGAQPLDPEQCAAIEPAQRAWLTPEWLPFADFVNVCPIREGAADPQLFIVTIRALDVEASLPENAPSPHYPRPLIMLADGTRVGELPYPFPDDPPRTLDVSFSKWRAGFPEQIMFYLHDPTVTGNRALPPVTWDAARKHYSYATTARGNSKDGY